MGHIEIIVAFIVLVLGLWAASYLYHIRKEYPYNFITTFIGIIVIHNAMMVFDLTRSYLAVNIVRDEEVFALSLYSRLSQPLISFLTFLVVFLLIRLLFQLSETKTQARVTWIFSSIVVLYTASYLARFVSIYVSSDLVVLAEIHAYVEFAVANCTYLILVYFSATNLFGKGTATRIHNGILAVFYLAFLLLCTFPLVQSKPWYYYYMTILMSAFNIFPLIWIKYLFLPRNLQEIRSHDIHDALNSLFHEKKITVREKEIAALILKGRSNKEIEGELCISVSTVKNHIYRLFKKLGINSRGQLVNLLLEHQNRGESRR